VRGVVTKMFADKGFGFARGEDGVSRFFHASWVEWGKFDMLQVGTTVDFIPEEGEKGAQAKGVSPVLGDDE